MSREILGLIIAGVIPAFMFSGAGLLQKYSTKKEITFEYNTTFMAIGMLFACSLFFILPSEKKLNSDAILPSLIQGFVFAFGIGLVTFGLVTFNTPLSKIVPIHTLSILITTIASLIIFKEMDVVNIWKLSLGLVLVLSGIFFVIKA